MKHGSLFSGVGGFDLAAEWMGWENMFHCEINKFCKEQLKINWPNAASFGDIKQTDFSIWRGKLDIITGGDPCQPHSIAGLGKGTEDDRFLWPEMFRAIRESQPSFVVNENVGGSISNGVIDIKIDDLESIGYACQTYCIPAESVGALHQRERVWLVAYDPNRHTANRKSKTIQSESGGSRIQEQHYIQYAWEPVDLRVDYSDSDIKRLKELNTSAESGIITEGVSRYFGFGDNPHGNFTGNEIKSGIIRMLNGLPEGMDYTARTERIKALGNAIVPQIAYEIFKAIDQFNATY